MVYSHGSSYVVYSHGSSFVVYSHGSSYVVCPHGDHKHMVPNVFSILDVCRDKPVRVFINMRVPDQLKYVQRVVIPISMVSEHFL